MGRLIFGRTEIRELDRRAIEEFAVPGIVLMENAGRGVAELAMGCAAASIVCGTGNNGGDGFVAARHLHNTGVGVRVFVVGDPGRIRGDAGVNLEIVRRMGIEVCSDGSGLARWLGDGLGEDGMLVDAIFGTGLDRPATGRALEAIEAINASRCRVLSVDLPSGMDCETGRGVCVRAEITGTLVGLKRGFSRPEARSALGRIEIIDIGVPRELCERLAG